MTNWTLNFLLSRSVRSVTTTHLSCKVCTCDFDVSSHVPHYVLDLKWFRFRIFSVSLTLLYLQLLYLSYSFTSRNIR